MPERYDPSAGGYGEERTPRGQGNPALDAAKRAARLRSGKRPFMAYNDVLSSEELAKKRKAAGYKGPRMEKPQIALPNESGQMGPQVSFTGAPPPVNATTGQASPQELARRRKAAGYNGPRYGKPEQLPADKLSALGPNDQQRIKQAYQRGGIGGLREATAGIPGASDIYEAARGAVENAPGRKALPGGGTPGGPGGGGGPVYVPGGGPVATNLSSPNVLSPNPSGPLATMGGQGSLAPSTGSVSTGVSVPVPPPIGVPQGLPPTPGGGQTTSVPPPTQVPQTPQNPFQRGGIREAWNPSDANWVKGVEAKFGPGYVQQVQQAINAAVANIPQGSGGRQQAIYDVLTQMGLTGGPGGPAIPTGQGPTGQRPVPGGGGTQTPPIYYPPTSGGPAGMEPVLTGQATPLPTVQGVPGTINPGIFNPF